MLSDLIRIHVCVCECVCVCVCVFAAERSPKACVGFSAIKIAAVAFKGKPWPVAKTHRNAV